MTDDLTALDEWIGALAARLQPGQRKQLAQAIGRELRRENVRRITANVDPDGASMAPRKPRVDRKTGRIKSRGKMFPKIRLARNLRVKADPAGVEVGFVNPAIERVAAVHQFGEEGYVGKTRDGRIIRTRYEARRLLGFGRADREKIADLAAQFLADN